MSTLPEAPKPHHRIHDRIELYLEAGSQPNALTYRWRFRSGRNGKTLAHGGQGYARRIDALRAASLVTGATINTARPDFTEPQPGIDGDVSVWLVDRRSRRGFPEGGQ